MCLSEPDAVAEDEQAHWEDDPAYMALYFPIVSPF